MTNRTWSEILRLLDSKQPIPKIYKTGEAVEFWREWDPSRNKAVWGKSYLRSACYDLSAFNQAEFEWLRRLSSNKVTNTYRASLLMHEGTMLAEPARVTIKTLDCGPTLCDWLRVPLSVEGRTQTHCLVQPEAYLTMVLNVLVALNGVHACHFVHCDIHQGNVTLPVDILEQNGTEVRLRPLWDQITLIDFGYSVNPSQPPTTTLPLSHSGADIRISMHLQSILQEIEEQAKPLLGDKEWAQVWLDTRWWQQLGPTVSPLRAFARLDWREDLYQFGRMLKDIRDGTGMACHLDGRTIRRSSCQSVEEMVSQLPEQLMELGANQTPGQDRPHLRIIGNIQQVLAQSRAMGNECPKEFHLKRADFEHDDGLISPALETRLTSHRPASEGNAWERNAPSRSLPVIKPVAHCLINQTHCGRKTGEQVCAKCGMDERVIYSSGNQDFDAEHLRAQLRYWNAHAQELESRLVQPLHKPQKEKLAQVSALVQTKEVFRDSSWAPEMVVIPAGSFMMGSNDGGDNEKPIHRVTLRSFALGKYVVTQGQWKALMGDNPSYFKDCGENCPVETVSWNAAQQFIQKLNQKTGQQYRLPSEAEWEYAARAGTTTAFWWGDSITTDQANYNGSPKGQYRQGTVPVNSFQPNPWGLYQMHGNVWEWVQDVDHKDYNGAPTDGSAWVSGGEQKLRVSRGGSWHSTPILLHSARRGPTSLPVYRSPMIGFRLAMTLPVAVDRKLTRFWRLCRSMLS